MTKAKIIDHICADRLIAIAQAESGEALAQLIRDLGYGGITTLELPLTIPAMPQLIQAALAELKSEDQGEVTLGLGTVIDTETAKRGIIAGAKFISTPALRPDVILLCRRHRVPVFCGVHSVPEINAAVAAGADAIKLYPSEDRFGPTHVREIRAQFPDLRIFPIGGVTASNAPDFIAAGADALFVASGLFPLEPEDALHQIPVPDRARALRQSITAAVN